MTQAQSPAPGGPSRAIGTKRGLRLEQRRRFRFALLGIGWLAALVMVGWLVTMSMIRPPRAAWVWDPSRYYSGEGFENYRRTTAQWRIETVFAQVHRAEDGTLSGSLQLRRFLENSARAGVRVFALAGEPEWINPEQLPHTTRLLDSIAAFNNAATPDGGGRLAGVQLDVEPYLLPEWSVAPDQVRHKWLRYVDAVTSHAHALRLEIGFAIPFWLNERMEHRGVTAPFYQHLMSEADHVAVMSYRSEVEGENGVEGVSRPVREYAGARPGVARVYVGVELTTQPATAGRFLTAASPPARPESLSATRDGMRVKLLHPGRMYLLGLSAPPSRPHDRPTSSALIELAREAGFATTAEEEVLAAAERELPGAEGYAGNKPFRTPLGTAFGKPLVAIDALETAPPGITLAGKSGEEIRETIRRIERRTAHGKGIRGVAVHDFAALEKLGVP